MLLLVHGCLRMFELNKNLNVRTEKVYDCNFQKLDDVHIVDNFYSNPDEIFKFLLGQDSWLHKSHENGLNGVSFEDRRFSIGTDLIYPAYEFLQNIHGQLPVYDGAVNTNQTKFFKQEFNNYKDNYWWPHTDEGYTAIVYLNKNDYVNGTNLYEQLVAPDNTEIEHQDPWKPKVYYNCLKHIEPAYNRLVLFNGLCYHGMNICNDRYFDDEYRLNQVFFFKNGTI